MQNEEIAYTGKAIQVFADHGYTDERLTGVRRTIAKVMHESLSTMAQLTHHSSFDATKLLDCRKRIKAYADSDITMNDMILFAVSRTLKKFPSFNAHFLDDKIRKFHSVNIGVAVETDRGLLVPTLYGADIKTLKVLSQELKELILATRTGRIDPDLLANGTFTVTNLGALGVEIFTPVINSPQTAILGVCSIQIRFKEIDGKLVHYPAMGLSLTYDHRAVDGAPAARFMMALTQILENFNEADEL
jgi:pyruvate dehydrogenase E2 component (dihydrolipoamide acetyltransferase)